MWEPLFAWARAIVRPAFLSAVIVTGVFASAGAAAQDYPVRTVGQWTVAASKDKSGCFLTRTYDGSGATTLLLGLDVDGSNRLSVLNENWSIKPQDRQTLSFRLSEGGYPDQPVFGMASDGKKGFVTSFESKFPAYFGGSKALHIYRGKVPVELLNLDGSGAAVAELRRCVALFKMRGKAGARDKDRDDGVPKDPFAPDAKRKSKD